MSTVDVLPVVDFGPFLVDEGCTVGEAPTEAQLRIAARIDSIMIDHGFFYLENFGVSDQVVNSAFDAARATFSPHERDKKASLAEWTPESNTGYSAIGEQSVNHARPADLREAFTVKAPHLSRNDFRGTSADLRGVAILWDRMQDTTKRLAIACALALGLPPSELDFFARAFSSFDNAAMILAHYPPCDFELGVSDGGERGGSIRVGEHADFGLFTFLFLEAGATGLQVMRSAAGEGGGLQDHSISSDSKWIDAVGRGGGSAIVNSGALLARWTNDRWRATTHRVVVHSAEEASCHRYSIPFFAQPDNGTTVAVHPSLTVEDEPPRYPSIAMQDWLRMKLQRMGRL